MAANTAFSMFRGPAPTPTPAPAPARTPASVAKTKPKANAPKAKPTPAPKPKYHTTTTTKTTTDTSTPHTPQNTLPLTDDQKWLKTHPHWTEQRTALWKKNNPNAQVEHRPGIEQTVLDAQTLAQALRATPEAYAKAAADLSTSMFNASQTAAELRPQDSAQRQTNVTNMGNELLKSLAGIQTANADTANGSINLFKSGGLAADGATNAQAIAAGGAPVDSTVYDAAGSLSKLGANMNNLFAGRQESGALQTGLFHRQEAQNLASGLAKLGTQRAADYASEYDRQQTAGDARVSNGLTYNLYNQQNTTKSQLGNRSLTLQQRIAKEKAWAATADRAIKEQQTQINADLAAGKITASEAADEKRILGAKAYVLTHQKGTSSGSTTWTIPFRWKKTVDTNVVDHYEGKTPIYKQKTVVVNKVISVDDSRYQSFLGSGKPGFRNTELLGIPKTAVRVGPATSKSTSSTGTGLSLDQARKYLLAAGISTADANAFLSGYQGA